MENSPDPKTAEAQSTETTTRSHVANEVTNEPRPSYVKLAMRNMVKKRGTSLKHFALTTIGLLAVLVGLAYITR